MIYQEEKNSNFIGDSNSVTTIVTPTSEKQSTEAFTNSDKQISARDKTIQLLSAWGLPALPVAPEQQNKKVFNGKRPSYLDSKGTAYTIEHKDYQDRLPTQLEQDKWFKNPKNGIGTLCGINNIIAIDIDRIRFDSEEDCNHAFQELLNRNPLLQDTYIESTPGGGYHILVECRGEKTFTDFSFDKDGSTHHGEVLGTGKFIVLAPSTGSNGNNYKSWNNSNFVEIESLESIGIYRHRDCNPVDKSTTSKTSDRIHIDLNQTVDKNGSDEQIIKNKCQSILIEISNSTEGTRNNTIHRKCVRAGGYLANAPHLVDWFLLEFEYSFDDWTKTKGWGDKEKSLGTAKRGVEAGIKKPLSVSKTKSSESIKVSNHVRIKGHIIAWLETAGDLEWNEMTLGMELNREATTAEALRQQFLDDIMSVDCGKEMFKDITVNLAQKNSYHPVREYIENLPANNDETILDSLYAAMGVSDKFHQLLIRKNLIASVARALKPGTKHDNVLVLKGAQGTKKTSYFETLYGTDFFQTLGKHRNEADEIMALTSTWCSEYGELETALGYKSVSEMKNFLTRAFDIYRAPYAEKQQKTLRAFVLVGTTNQDAFLSDSTGNRRFWVVDIKEEINIKRVKEIRDSVWAVAKTLYLNGEIHWLNREQEKLAEINVADYETEDMLAPQVLSLMKSNEWATTVWLADELHLEKDRRTEMRLADILRKAKCETTRKTINGQRAKYWRYTEHWDNHHRAIEEQKQKKQEQTPPTPQVEAPKVEKTSLEQVLEGWEDRRKLVKVLQTIPYTEYLEIPLKIILDEDQKRYLEDCYKEAGMYTFTDSHIESGLGYLESLPKT
ncbi:hypothetical protein BV378_20680 [Nostoc sp. RF31YmG]|jgi:predicted P-loop ATPase|nr:hypothetical protein BV378_20680 [Nostoc sp. RF31YmG]